MSEITACVSPRSICHKEAKARVENGLKDSEDDLKGVSAPKLPPKGGGERVRPKDQLLKL